MDARHSFSRIVIVVLGIAVASTRVEIEQTAMGQSRPLQSKRQSTDAENLVNAVNKDGSSTGQKTELLQEETRRVVDSSNEFACAVFDKLRRHEGNLIFSPASVSIVLAMTSAGAAGETKKQMARTLHLDIPDAQIHAGFGKLNGMLNDRTTASQLRLANRVWGQKGLEFESGFVRLTDEQYGAELGRVDFSGNPELSRQTINQWVESQTNEKIKDLIPRGQLNSMTEFVLTSAIYFEGSWAHPFRGTHRTKFRVSGDTQADVQMMQKEKLFARYADAGDVKLLELPYREIDKRDGVNSRSDGEVRSMLIILPKNPDGLTVVEDELSIAKLKKWTSLLRRQEVNVFLPRFKMTMQMSLSEPLNAMGMHLPFTSDADFSGIAKSRHLRISGVVHKAFIDVNEKGTEAGAGTGVKGTGAGVGTSKPVVFRADHPFLFMIRDNQAADVILFLGRFARPEP